jgi:hypothetical protein
MAQLKQSSKVVEYDKHGNKIVDVELRERLPYCSRAVPLKFRAAFDPNDYVVWIDFGDFKISHEGNLYYFLAMKKPWKGIAKDRNGKVLAEAVALDKAPDGVMLRETHFDDKEGVRFSAKTFLDFDGVKRQESETIGHKAAEYFFYCPMREH